MNLRVIKILKI